MLYVWRLLAAFALMPTLSACSTRPPAYVSPVLMECPRPGPDLLRRVPPLDPIPTQPRAREPQDLPQQTPTSELGPSEPEPPMKPAAQG